MPTSLVSVDGQRYYRAAYVAEHTWNGFVIPAFDTATAMLIMADTNAMHDEYPDTETFTYDAATGYFMVTTDYGNGPETTYVERQELDGPIHFMGDSWTWQSLALSAEQVATSFIDWATAEHIDTDGPMDAAWITAWLAYNDLTVIR